MEGAGGLVLAMAVGAVVQWVHLCCDWRFHDKSQDCLNSFTQSKDKNLITTAAEIRGSPPRTEPISTTCKFMLLLLGEFLNISLVESKLLLSVGINNFNPPRTLITKAIRIKAMRMPV